MDFSLNDRVKLKTNHYNKKGIKIGDEGEIVKIDSYGWWTNYIVKFDNGIIDGFACENWELAKII